MSAPLHQNAPGDGAHHEDRLFHQVLATTLALLLLLGSIVPNILLPQLAVDAAAQLPPRLARIITAGSAPLSDTATEGRRTQAKAKAKAKAPSVVARPATTPRPAEQKLPGRENRAVPLRRRVDKAGVLALGDALAQLRNATPNITNSKVTASKVKTPNITPSERRQPVSQHDGKRGSSRSGILTAGVTEGSGGTDVDTTALQQLLGTAGLQAEQVAGAGPRLEDGIIASLSPGDRHALTSNSRTEEEIQKVLNRNKSAIYKLYNRELRTAPSLRGKVVLSIMIAPAGQVTRARIVYSELNSASLEQRLIQLIKRIDFGAKPGVPSVTTNVPIEFFPV